MNETFDEIVQQFEYVRDHGHYVSTLCPYHNDREPSLLIFGDGRFVCLACGERGNLTKLQKQLNGWTAPDVIVKSSGCSSVLPSDIDDLLSVVYSANRMLKELDDPLANYIRRRGIYNRIVPQKLGYYKGWYTIPIFDRKKVLQGVIARASDAIQESTGRRYDIPKGQEALVYVPDWKLVDDSDYIIVVYGMIDALSLCELGFASCTPTSGKDSMKPDMLDDFRKRIIVIPDKGEENTARKLVSGLGWRGKELLLEYPDECKDPNDLLSKGYGQWLSEQIRKEIE